MHLLRLLQVAVAIATIFYLCCVSQSSAELACTSPQLDDIVRRISEARFGTRDTKPKLARCHRFLELIRGQQELELAKTLELRAACPGQPMGGLSSLQEFTEDCQELIELAACGSQPISTMAVANKAEESTRLSDDRLKNLPLNSVAELEKENAKLLREVDRLRHLEAENSKLSRSLDELQRLQELSGNQAKSKIDELMLESKEKEKLLANQEKTGAKLSEQKMELARELDELRRASEREKKKLNHEIAQQSRALDELHSNEAKREVRIVMLEQMNADLRSELSELQDAQGVKQEAKAANTCAMQIVPGTTREIEVRRDAREQLGIFLSGDIYGGVFVTQVMAGSPAARAGLRFGDQLIQVNGRAIIGRDLVEMIQSSNPVRLMIRKSPLEQTFVLKREQGKPAPGFDWSRWDLEVLGVRGSDGMAARAGLLEEFKLIAVNGESVLGVDGATMTKRGWWPEGDFTVTVMPNDFHTKLIEGLGDASLEKIRIQMNKILADERAGQVCDIPFHAFDR